MRLKSGWLLAATLLIGCSGEPQEVAVDLPTNPPAVSDNSGPATAPGISGAEKLAPTSVVLSEEEIAEIKKLPEAEQAPALAQKVCPVSDENLGSMGTPIKVEADGKVAYLCCDGCKKSFEADPAKALAKIGK